MSDGELKKRINEDRKKYGGEDADYIVMERHLMVLSEAKKDFPRIFSSTCFDMLWIGQNAQVLDLKEWFMKWFGDAEK